MAYDDPTTEPAPDDQSGDDPTVNPLVPTDITAPPFIPIKPYLAVGAVGSEITLICAAESVDVTVDQDENVTETFCGATTSYKAQKWMITASSFLSYGTAGLWNSLHPLSGTVVPFKFRPDTAVSSASNPEMAGTAYLKAVPFFSGGPGEPKAVDIVLAVQGMPTWTP